MEAIAYFNPEDGNLLTGEILFIQTLNGVIVEINLEGPISNGYHGLHVHTKPIDCLKKYKNISDCCSTLLGHYVGEGNIPWSEDNPNGIPHGLHVGDLVFNIMFKNGIADTSYIDEVISLIPGHPHNIVGRSIVLHKNEDDKGLGNNIKSKITGNAGKMIDCANIFYL